MAANNVIISQPLPSLSTNKSNADSTINPPLLAPEGKGETINDVSKEPPLSDEELKEDTKEKKCEMFSSCCGTTPSEKESCCYSVVERVGGCISLHAIVTCCSRALGKYCFEAYCRDQCCGDGCCEGDWCSED